MKYYCRRSKDQERILNTYRAHYGPVYAVQRNPSFSKHFLTVGDWSAKVWSDDITESSLFTTGGYTEKITDGCWSPSRPSVFYVTRTDGVLDTWDILYKVCMRWVKMQ